jgi:two-component system cell cycle response regulator DivK
MAKRVLVVEDYEDTREMMRLMIEQHGYAVLEAAGPYEAIEKATEFHPDLILMDIGLPLMDGLSTAEVINGNEGLADIPIVAVTAYHDVKSQVMKAGCTGVLYKPVDPTKLKLVLDTHLAGASAGPSIQTAF